MADYAIWSGATGANDGSSWANAFTTLQAAIAVTTFATAENRFFVASDHAELVSTTIVFWPAQNGIISVISSDRASGFPPTAELAGATVGSTSATNLTLQNSFYSKGVFWQAGDNSTGLRNFVIDSTGGYNFIRIVGGGISLKNTGAGSRIVVGTGATNRNTRLTLENAEIRFGAAGQGFQMQQGSLVIKGGATAGSAITEFIKTFNNVVANVDVRSFDMSTCGAGLHLLASSIYGIGRAVFDKIKAPASWTGGLISAPSPYGAFSAIATNVDNAATNYRMMSVDQGGRAFSETAIVRTGGSDGLTPLSWRLVTSVDQRYQVSAFSAPEIVVWNETVGSAVTVTVEVLTDNVTLTDAECWLEVDYPSSTSSPLGAVVADELVGQLTTPANQATSGVGWTTTGLTTPIAQKLSVTFTPQAKGFIRAVVKLAKHSTTVYVCPKADLT